jgi:hypothetical protein
MLWRYLAMVWNNLSSTIPFASSIIPLSSSLPSPESEGAAGDGVAGPNLDLYAGEVAAAVGSVAGSEEETSAEGSKVKRCDVALAKDLIAIFKEFILRQDQRE